jgi:hypothetical protein
LQFVAQSIAGLGLSATVGIACCGEKLFVFLRFCISRCEHVVCGKNGSGGAGRLWYTRSPAKHSVRRSCGCLEVGRGRACHAWLLGDQCCATNANVGRPMLGDRSTRIVEARLRPTASNHDSRVLARPWPALVDCPVESNQPPLIFGKTVDEQSHRLTLRRCKPLSAQPPSRLAQSTEVNVSLNICGCSAARRGGKSLPRNDLQRCLTRSAFGRCRLSAKALTSMAAADGGRQRVSGRERRFGVECTARRCTARRCTAVEAGRAVRGSARHAEPTGSGTYERRSGARFEVKVSFNCRGRSVAVRCRKCLPQQDLRRH